jgi:chromosome partitioning protein
MLIALANSKGGVGKTTVSVHYAVAQAERGRKTALIDSDAQGSSTRWLQDIQDTVAVFPLKTADDVIDQAPKIVSQFDVVVADGPAGLSEVTRALLLVADLALLPCGPSALDLRAAQDAIRVVQQAQMIRKVEKWVGHIGQQLDGIMAKRADAPYRPGDDHSTLKI